MGRCRRLAEKITQVLTPCSFEVHIVILCVQLGLIQSTGSNFSCQSHERRRAEYAQISEEVEVVCTDRSWVKVFSNATQRTPDYAWRGRACLWRDVSDSMSGSRVGYHNESDGAAASAQFCDATLALKRIIP